MMKKKILFLLLTVSMLVLSACSNSATGGPQAVTPSSMTAVSETETATPAPANLEGTEWTLVSYGKSSAPVKVVPGSNSSIQFKSGGQVSGSGGCNSFGGAFQANQEKISFSNLIHTEMACVDQQIMQQEQQYLAALETASTFNLAADQLTITYEQGQSALIFTPGTAAAQPTTQAETPPASSETPAAAGQTAMQSETALTDVVSASDYLDDRSTAVGLIQSYFNAISRKEYLRAYSYWKDPASALGSFEKFEQGYANTDTVSVQFGNVTGDFGAGQMYYTVTALLNSKTTDGKSQAYAACYALHLSQPAVQATPPFVPMSIEKGQAKQVDNSTRLSDLGPTTCSSLGIPAGNPMTVLPNHTDITKENYLDERSDAVKVLSSLFNAINRKEYLRAYSYWEKTGSSSPLPSFEDFEKGYADTESVELTTGEVQGDAGAGQFFSKVPVVLKVQTTNGSTQTFAGCYQLHLSSPGAQATPPFRPMAIQSATVKQVSNDANPANILTQQCK
jgi:heat shock protein HslJ